MNCGCLGRCHPGIGGLARAGFHRRIDNRAVARAAAEIARDMINDLLPRRLLARVIKREQRHDETRRAEAALRGMIVDKGLLHGMQFSADGQIINRDQFLAINLARAEECRH